jgi:hypothetical protein
MDEPLALLGDLADLARLRVFAVLVLEPRTAGDVATAVGTSTRDVMRALRRLEGAGLVRRDGVAWVAVPQRLREVVVSAARPRPSEDRCHPDADDAAVLRAFFIDGRLARIPAHRAKRLIALDHICRVFAVGERYVEADVNASLLPFHEDVAALRRHLVDEGFLTRGGGEYWRTGGTVEV